MRGRRMFGQVILYAISLALFLVLDLGWLGFVARDLYRTALGPLMAMRFNMGAAILFYLLFVVGLTIFGIEPGIRANDWRPAALYGGLFGFFAYLTYDMTNLATLEGYPARLAIIDLAWGTCLSAVVAALTIVIGKVVLGDLSA